MPVTSKPQMLELPSPINMFKDVTIIGRKLNGLEDTGSNLTLLRNSTYISIEALPLKQTNPLLIGFGFSRNAFDSEIIIDDQIFPVTFSVVPNSPQHLHHLLPINMFKDVTIIGRKLNGLEDTGSNLTLLRNSTYISIEAPPLKQTNPLLIGFLRINVIGTFDSEIIIDDQIFPVTFSVVPNSCTNYDLIISCDRAEVEQLLSTYTPKKTKTVNIELDIALTDDEPIFHKPRRLPFAERDIVDAQVDEWVKNRIVEPCSSPYASQVVVVKKKDRKSRVCIDYRRLNRKLIKDDYPLLLIDDILDCLQSAKIFTTLDLKNGFFHVTVNERSRKFTSFVTHNGVSINLDECLLD
ncbi:putative blastopia polyprotein [Trichonephila clavipes]|nr:putative blastopia polyprotein [Trichonephila clavipes]